MPYGDVIGSEGALPPEVPTPGGDGVIALMYTSGTTGAPKGATITHRNWVGMIRSLMTELPTIYDTDLVLQVAPMGHLSGSVGTAYSARGVAPTFLTRFDPREVLENIEELGVSALTLAPFLQLYQVLSAQSGITRCEQCNKLIFGAQTNTRFCSGRCRANHDYQSGNRAKRKRRKEGTS